MSGRDRSDPWGFDAHVNQAGAELAFAKFMGWHDWHPDEEEVAGMVRGYRVQWSPDPNAGLVVHRGGLRGVPVHGDLVRRVVCWLQRCGGRGGHNLCRLPGDRQSLKKSRGDIAAAPEAPQLHSFPDTHGAKLIVVV